MHRDCDLTQQREGAPVSIPDSVPLSQAVVNQAVPSRIPSAPGASQPGQPAPVRIVPPRSLAPRAPLVTLNASTNNTSQAILPANEKRCYFLVQNTGNLAIRVAFGLDAGPTSGLLLNPGASYEAPVAPTNSVAVFGPVGGTFAILYANDQ